MRRKLNFSKSTRMCVGHKTKQCAYALLPKENWAYVCSVPEPKVCTMGNFGKKQQQQQKQVK